MIGNILGPIQQGQPAAQLLFQRDDGCNKILIRGGRHFRHERCMVACVAVLQHTYMVGIKDDHGWLAPGPLHGISAPLLEWPS